MNRRYLLTFTIASLGSLVLSCTEGESERFTKVRKDRTCLIRPFRSYACIDEARELLSRTIGTGWKVIEDSRTVKVGERRPPFWIYGVEIAEFESFGVYGRLVLHFFNDRLLSTSFYPGNPEVYKAAIQSELKLNLDVMTKLDYKTIVKTGLDFEKKLYVTWEDARLAEELFTWIVKHA